MKFTDVTAYLLATGAVMLAGLLFGSLLWAIRRYIQNLDAKLSRFETDLQNIKQAQEKIDVLSETREMKGRVETQEKVLSGISSTMVSISRDYVQGMRRELQKTVQDEMVKRQNTLKDPEK